MMMNVELLTEYMKLATAILVPGTALGCTIYGIVKYRQMFKEDR